MRGPRLVRKVKAPAPAPPVNRWRHQILVVDDDAEHRRDLCELLQEEGYRTLGAWNGREAFGLLLTATATPSLIVLDLVMSSVSGREFRERQLENPRFAPVPVVIVSGMPGGAEVARSMRVSGFLPKPLDPDAFIAEVDRVLAPSRKS